MTKNITTSLTILICILPYFLMKVGIDFNYYKTSQDLYSIMGGQFIHTILEWSSVMMALITGIMGICYYYVKKDVVIPILCIALFSAGSLDAFHTLAADHLINSNADNTNLIPFTWAISRVFDAIILLIGVILFSSGFIDKKYLKLDIIVFCGITSIILAFFIIQYCATSLILPQTIFPNNIITRPWDVIPLILYIILAIILFKFYKEKKINTYFEYALLFSMFPQIVVEIHMAFGSTALFDDHFNIAHFLKIIAYMFPLIGLIFEYVNTSRKLKETNIKLLKSQETIKESNKKLEHFAYIASHDLQEPLRMISSYIQLIERKYKNTLDEDGKEFIGFVVDGSKRMKQLIEDLLKYSRSSSSPKKENINIGEIVSIVISDLSFKDQEDMISIMDPLPIVLANYTQMTQLFQNIISNGIKYQNGSNKIKIIITCKSIGNMWKIGISDNGIGIESQYLKEIFNIFNRLHGDDEYSGTGLGLAVCQNIVNNFEGDIWVESEYNKGSTFYFTIEKI